MFIALAFTFATGCSFALISMIISSLAREKISFFQFYAVSNLLAGITSWILLPNWSKVPEVSWSGVLLLTLCAGVINTVSQAGMVLSLRYGHNGISVAIRNSAALISMLFGVIFLHEQVSFINLAGVFLLIVSLAVIAITGKKGNGNYNLKRWLPAVILSFLMSGCYQIVMTANALLPETVRSAGVRIPCLFCACATSNAIASLIEWKVRSSSSALFHFERKQLLVMLLWVGAAMLQYWLLLQALDAMHKSEMSALTWPLLIGINVTTFSIFCRLKWREKYPLGTIIGMTGTIIGLILIIWGRK